MLLDQETLRFVFGMKLRGLRLDKGLSLKELSKKTGLSPSYLNEIEKGKKYPKSEKILLLAEALNETYEDLISLELKKDLQLVQNLLDRKFLTGIPFELFGIPGATVFELLAERPRKMRALIGTILEIARAHRIHADDFYFALLRAYIDMHENSFPSLETAAQEFAARHAFRWDARPAEIKQHLIRILGTLKVEVIETDLRTLSAEFAELLYLTTERGRKLYLSSEAALPEQVLILAREAGHRHLKTKSRPQSSLIRQLDSFDQLFGHFSANYFASSLLIPEKEIVEDLRAWFVRPSYEPERFEALLAKYQAPRESLFHRLSQVLPKHFGCRHLFFLRYEYDVKFNRYEIARELHLTGSREPHQVKGGQEHYCSRWLIHRLTKAQEKNTSGVNFGLQRSRYAGTENEYLVIGTALREKNLPGRITSVCIGLLANPELEQKISWAKSPAIPAMVVGETCERCAVRDCDERQAALDPRLDPERFDRIFQALKSL